MWYYYYIEQEGYIQLKSLQTYSVYYWWKLFSFWCYKEYNDSTLNKTELKDKKRKSTPKLSKAICSDGQRHKMPFM